VTLNVKLVFGFLWPKFRILRSEASDSGG